MFAGAILDPTCARPNENLDSIGYTLERKEIPIHEKRKFIIQVKLQNERKYLDIRLWALGAKGKWYPKRHGLFCELDFFKRNIMPILNQLCATL